MGWCFIHFNSFSKTKVLIATAFCNVVNNYCRFGQHFYYSRATKHYRPDMLVYPTHIKFDLDFDIDNKYVQGEVTHSLHYKADSREIVFHAESLDVEQVTINDKPVEFENTGHELRVHFKGKKGQDIQLKVVYSVSSPKAGLYFVLPDEHYPNVSKQVWTQGQDEDTRFYAPVMDNPAYKHTSEFIGRIPQSWTSLSNGNLVDDRIENGKRVMHWNFDYKHSTYLVTFAAGDLFEHKENSEGVEIRWYAQKGREKEAENAYKRTSDIIQFFSEYTGVPYPYGSYSQWSASRFVFGGMENTGATTQTDLTLRDDRAAIDSRSENLVAHEAAHQWFGDWITAKTWGHAWLHESFATYFDALYIRNWLGEDEFRYQMRSNMQRYLSEDGGKYRRPIVTNMYAEPIDIFDSHLYPGGSWRVHMLRHLLTEDVFREVLKYYLDKHAMGSVETVDLQRAIEDVSGRNMDWFFDQWLYHAGYPKLKMKYSWDENSSLAKITITQVQKNRKGDTISHKLFRIPSALAFYKGELEQKFDIDIRDKEHTFYFELPWKPDYVRFDPDYSVLATLEFSPSQSMLIAQLKEDRDAIGRIQAAEELAKKPNSAVIREFHSVLHSDVFWGVRSVVAKALGKTRYPAAKKSLVEALNDPHPKVRRAVVQALSEFKDDTEVGSVLEEKYKNGDESYFVEGELLKSLGIIRHQNAHDSILEGMKKPSYNDFAVISGLEGLVALDTEESLDQVIEYSKYGMPELGRITAITAIGKLGKHRPHRHPECIRLLGRYGSDPLFRCRMAAINGLKQLAIPGVIPLIVKIGEQEADGRVKGAAELAVKQVRKNLEDRYNLKDLEDQIDSLRRQNLELKERLDKVEELLKK